MQRVLPPPPQNKRESQYHIIGTNVNTLGRRDVVISRRQECKVARLRVAGSQPWSVAGNLSTASPGQRASRRAQRGWSGAVLGQSRPASRLLEGEPAGSPDFSSAAPPGRWLPRQVKYIPGRIPAPGEGRARTAQYLPAAHCARREWYGDRAEHREDGADQ